MLCTVDALKIFERCICFRGMPIMPVSGVWKGIMTEEVEENKKAARRPQRKHRLRAPHPKSPLTQAHARALSSQ